jgi:V8-like Glu-specific endopeptidase
MKRKSVSLAIRALAAIAVSVLMTQPAWAEAPLQPVRTVSHELNTGAHDGLPDETFLAYREVVEFTGAPWLRLHFGSYNLGKTSYLKFIARHDGGWQRLDAKSMPQWHASTAFFTGDAVTVELHVGPGDRGVFALLERVTVGQRRDGSGASYGTSTLCSGDDRVSFSDGRVGRVSYDSGVNPACTAWITLNGALVTAGHCVDLDTGSGTPHARFRNALIEFNVPASLPDGTTQPSDPDDQYPIDAGSIVFNNGAADNDWGVFECSPNSNTQLLPALAQGDFLRLTLEEPDTNQYVRVTGYGLDKTPPGTSGDENAQTRTEQTDTGLYRASLRYRVDTTGANSGSPVIWEAYDDFALGHHVLGECAGPLGSNRGTPLSNTAYETAIWDVPGANTVYADILSMSSSENGSPTEPYDTVTEAVSAAFPGSIICIIKGSYLAIDGNTFVAGTGGKAMILYAPVGTVTIGE